MEKKEAITRLTSTYTTGRTTFNKASLAKFFCEYYPLLSVLIGFMLVSLSAGPFYNGDTAWEYTAVSGVLKTGLPYANGYLMDQPPLGFYIQAGLFKAFGASIANGTLLVTFFAVACIALVYGIGKVTYNKTTGFVAAVLFAFSPWNLVLSRSFLIDVPCLFFSLLSLLTGLIAVQRGSFRLLVVSGIVFAAAFSTKLYAAFILLPLLAAFVYYPPKNLKHALTWVAAFSIPVLIATFLWYQTITGLGVTSIFGHTDFNTQNSGNIVPTYFFVTNFLINYGLGWFFLDAIIVSLLVVIAQKRLLQKFLVFDMIFFATVASIVGVSTFLGAILDLKAPFLNAFKYDFQSLPYFCLLAAALASKSTTLLNSAKTKVKLNKLVFYTVGVVGLVLVAAATVYSMLSVRIFSSADFLLFRVEPGANIGYSIFNSAPISSSGVQMWLQFFGFAVAFSGLVWLSRRRLRLLFRANVKQLP